MKSAYLFDLHEYLSIFSKLSLKIEAIKI